MADENDTVDDSHNGAGILLPKRLCESASNPRKNSDRWMKKQPRRGSEPDSPIPPLRRYPSRDRDKGLAGVVRQAVVPLNLNDDSDRRPRFERHDQSKSKSKSKSSSVLKLDHANRLLAVDTSDDSGSHPISCLPSTPHALGLPESVVSPMESPTTASDEENRNGGSQKHQQQNQELKQFKYDEVLKKEEYLRSQSSHRQRNLPRNNQREHTSLLNTSSDARTATTVATGDTPTNHTTLQQSFNSTSLLGSSFSSTDQMLASPGLLGAMDSLPSMFQDEQPSLSSTTSPPPAPPKDGGNGVEESEVYYDDDHRGGVEESKDCGSVGGVEKSKDFGNDVEPSDVYGVGESKIHSFEYCTGDSDIDSRDEDGNDDDDSFDAEIKRSLPQVTASFSYSCATYSPESRQQQQTQPVPQQQQPIAEESADDGSDSENERVAVEDPPAVSETNGLNSTMNSADDDDSNAFDLLIPASDSASEMSSLHDDPMNTDDDDEDFTEVEVESTSSDEDDDQGSSCGSSSVPSDYFTSSVDYDERSALQSSHQVSSQSDWCDSIQTDEDEPADVSTPKHEAIKPLSRRSMLLTQSKVPTRSDRSRSKSQPPTLSRSVSSGDAPIPKMKRRQSSPGSDTYSEYSATLSYKPKKLNRIRRTRSFESSNDASTADGILCPTPKPYQKKPAVKLSGRKRELKTLQDAITRLCDASKRKEIVWINGQSGVGKSALLESFYHQQQEQQETTFFTGLGAFDESVATALPFSGLATSLGELVERMTQNNPDAWKARLQAGLGSESHILACIVPGLSSFLGLDEETMTVSDHILQRKFDRLRFAIRTFLAIVCRHQPVVLLLDDLQWACPSTIQMMETFLLSYSVENLLVIACHRGIRNDHPLSALKLKFGDRSSSTVHLSNLRADESKLLITRHLKRFCCDVRNDAEKMNALVASLYRKTSGHPLFLTQLLHYLNGKGMIEGVADYDDLAVDPTIPSNANDLAGARASFLKSDERLILKSMCSLPHTNVRVETLLQAIVAAHQLSKSKDGECPISSTATLKTILESPLLEDLIDQVDFGSYRFVHDSVRQGVRASLLPKGTKKSKLLHLSISVGLEKLSQGGGFTSSDTKMSLFIADQKSKSIELIHTDKDRSEFAMLYLGIAEFLIEKAAFALAASSLEAGISLLDLQNRWSSKNYKLSMKLFVTLGRAKYFNRKYDEAISFCNDAVKHSKNGSDKIAPNRTIILSLIEQKQFDEAHKVNINFLKDLGLNFPVESVTKTLTNELELIATTLISSSDAELLTMPKMSHKKSLAKMSFLASLAEIARLQRDSSSEALAAIHMIRLILQYGTCDSKSFAFSLYSSCLSRRGDHKGAFCYGRLAEMMSDTPSSDSEDALTIFYSNVHHWRRPYEESLEPLLRLSRSSLEACAIERLSPQLGSYLSNFLLSGERLEPIEDTIIEFQRVILDYTVPDVWLITSPYHLMCDLTGRKRLVLDVAQQSDGRGGGYARSMQHRLFFQMIRAFYFSETENAEKIRQQLFFKPDGMWIPFRAFVEGMITVSLARESNGKTKSKFATKARNSLTQLEKWTLDGSVNCMHMEKLLRVEITLLSGRKASSMKARYLFDAAIAAAAKGNYLHHRALASERAALYFVSVDDIEWASPYMKQACRLYHSWGALGKVKQLATDFQEIIEMDDKSRLIDVVTREQQLLSSQNPDSLSRTSISDYSSDDDWPIPNENEGDNGKSSSNIWKTIPTSYSSETFPPSNTSVGIGENDLEVEPVGGKSSKPSSLQRILGRSWNKKDRDTNSSITRSKSFSVAAGKSSAKGRSFLRRKKPESDASSTKKGRRNQQRSVSMSHAPASENQKKGGKTKSKLRRFMSFGRK